MEEMLFIQTVEYKEYCKYLWLRFSLLIIFKTPVELIVVR